MKFSIGVVGLWHLGCVLSAVWSKLGNKVVGFDYDQSRVNNLNNSIPPVYEPFLADAIREGIESNLLSFSNEMSALSDCDFVFLAYDTPVRDDDSSDTSILMKATVDLGVSLKKGAILIISSQSPVGFCSILRETLKKTNPTLELAYSPENLRLGEAIDCYLHPERIVLGSSTQECEKNCRELFTAITHDVLPMSLESAEMVKHGINSFLASGIVFANHLADICELKGANINDVVMGVKSDPRIGTRAYLSPGIGFSGGTLGRDLKVLDEVNRASEGNADLFGIVHRLNSERKVEIIEKLKNLLGGVEGRTIGVLGITYKPGTSTLRRSLPIEIVDLLLENHATVNVYDPKADYSELSHVPKFIIKASISEVATEANLLLLLTEWKEFRDFDWGTVVRSMKTPMFFDTKNYLDKGKMMRTGFKYLGLGNPK